MSAEAAFDPRFQSFKKKKNQSSGFNNHKVKNKVKDSKYYRTSKLSILVLTNKSLAFKLFLSILCISTITVSTCELLLFATTLL